MSMWAVQDKCIATRMSGTTAEQKAETMDGQVPTRANASCRTAHKALEVSVGWVMLPLLGPELQQILQKNRELGCLDPTRRHNRKRGFTSNENGSVVTKRVKRVFLEPQGVQPQKQKNVQKQCKPEEWGCIFLVD